MHVAVVGQGLLSRGGECVLFGQLDRGSRLEPVIVDELWERKPMRPAVGLEEVAAWVAGCGVTCRTSRRLIMISHPWSGVVQIHDLGRRYILDLYNEQTRLIVLDAVYEIVVDVTRLATIRGGELHLPPLTRDVLLRHILGGAWFRFLPRDKDYRPTMLRRGVEILRPRPGLRLQQALIVPLMNRLLSVVEKPPQDLTRVRDELRCLTAAVEGLSLRGRG